MQVDKQATTPAKRRRSLQQLPVHLAKNRMLIVDDDIVSRKVTRNLLEAMGYSASAIYSANNGADAVDSVKQHPVDVILMDLHMPGMTGFETTQRIRQLWCAPGSALAQKKPPHVIALSATVTEEDQRLCKQSGIDAWLLKPVTYATLLEVLEPTESAAMP